MHGWVRAAFAVHLAVAALAPTQLATADAVAPLPTEGTAWAALLHVEGSGDTLELRAAVVEVTVFERKVSGPARLRALGPSETFSIRTFHNATIMTLGDSDGGVVGLYGGPSSWLSVEPSPATRVVPRGPAAVGDARHVREDLPNESYFRRFVADTHAHVQTRAPVALSGTWGAKVLGPTIGVVTPDDLVTVDTGLEQSTFEDTIRWAYVRAEGVEGRASMGDGRLEAALSLPTPASDQDLASSSDAIRVDPRGTITYSGPAWVVTLGTALSLAVAGAVGAFTVWHRSTRPRPRAQSRLFPVDEAARIASDAAAAQRWDEALLWTRRARALAPSSVQLLLDEAFFLDRVGRAQDALAAYDEAAARCPDDGEADFHAGHVLMRTGAPSAEVALRFARCLERSPALVHEFLEGADGEYRALFEHAAFREAVDEALALEE